ncbi:MAG: hypothetical protein H6622_04550 [Halobacteriovoraceae bacterium]|nr:hypothetical protein [Halobacteriovoraceae bacterium]
MKSRQKVFNRKNISIVTTTVLLGLSIKIIADHHKLEYERDFIFDRAWTGVKEIFTLGGYYSFENAVQEYHDLHNKDNKTDDQIQKIKNAKDKIQNHIGDLEKELNELKQRKIDLKNKYGIKMQDPNLEDYERAIESQIKGGNEHDDRRRENALRGIKSVFRNIPKLEKNIEELKLFIGENKTEGTPVHSLESAGKISHKKTDLMDHIYAFKMKDHLVDARFLLLDLNIEEMQKAIGKLEDSTAPFYANINQTLVGYFINGQISKAVGNICELEKACREADDKVKSPKNIKRMIDKVLQAPMNSKLEIPDHVGDFKIRPYFSKEMNFWEKLWSESDNSDGQLLNYKMDTE